MNTNAGIRGAGLKLQPFMKISFLGNKQIPLDFYENHPVASPHRNCKSSAIMNLDIC